MLPWRDEEKSCRGGMGYLSGVVTWLRCRKSPHGLQSPDFFGTMCRGDAQGLLEGRMMPMSNMCWNSFLLAHNRSGERRLVFMAMGGPVVTWSERRCA